MSKILNLNESEIITLYNSGLSSIKIAKQLNCSDSYIRKVLKKNNILMRSNKIYRTTQQFNENFFEKIDTEKKAYWLGFLYADGNVIKRKNQYLIQLRVNDKEVIDYFIRDINGNMTPKEYLSMYKKPYYGVFLTSKKMFNDLCKHGCIPNKSSILKFPLTVPKNLIWHFIRGYFDGDGSVYLLQKKWIKTPKTNPTICYNTQIGISFNGTWEFLTELNKILKIHMSKERRRTTNCWILRSSDKNVIEDFSCRLYKNASVWLPRKKEIFDNYFKITFNDYNGDPSE